MDDALTLSPLPAPKFSPLVERLSQDRVARRDVDESTVDPATRNKLRKSADEFESVFVSQMMSHMFEGVEVDETFGGGHGEEMFRSMLTEQYGKLVTQRGGFGLADGVYRELLAAQEASAGA